MSCRVHNLSGSLSPQLLLSDSVVRERGGGGGGQARCCGESGATDN